MGPVMTDVKGEGEGGGSSIVEGGDVIEGGECGSSMIGGGGVICEGRQLMVLGSRPFR